MATSSCAPAPFDHAKADVILQSADGVEFRVFRLFLSLASPFFETLFDLPQTPEGATDQDMKDGLPVIAMSEDSKTLDSFLRFCYPSTLAEDPFFENLADLLPVLATARKYSLDLIETRVCQALADPKLLAADPLHCFAIARNARLTHETIVAAKYTLRQPLIPTWFAEIELITASELLALLTYHKACSVAIQASLRNLIWMRAHYVNENGCGWLFGKDQYRTLCCGQATDRDFFPWNSSAPHLWWATYMQEMFELLRDRPSGETVRIETDNLIRTVRFKNCAACSDRVKVNMVEFTNLFASKVEEVVASIELQMDF